MILIVIDAIYEVEMLHLDAGYEVGYERIRFNIILELDHGSMFGDVIVTCVRPVQDFKSI